MRIQIPNDTRPHTVPLGRLGEQNVTEVAFDISDWLTEYGEGGDVVLLIQRPGDSAAYPVEPEAADGLAVYSLTDADTQYAGKGKMQLRYSVGGEIVKKSQIYSTITLQALDGSGEVPEPWQSWVDELTELKNDAEAAAQEASGYVADLTALLQSMTWTLKDNGHLEVSFNA